MKSNNPGTTLKRFYNRINGLKTEYNLTPYYEKIIEIKKHEVKFNIQTDRYLKDTVRRLRDLAAMNYSLDQPLLKTCLLQILPLQWRFQQVLHTSGSGRFW